ncbi:MAG: IclR family transcriptional regulator [Halodesulfurarchaeum sp.]
MGDAPIQSVDRLFDIIETLQARNGAGVSELASSMDMPKSTVHGHLSSLEKRGYVEQLKDDTYHLSLKFLTLGGKVRHQRTIFNEVEPLLAEIAEETGERVNYVIESRGDLVFVGSTMGKDGIRTEVDIGYRGAIHDTPEGKITLACLPKQRRECLLDRIDFPIGNSVGRAAFTAELEKLCEEKIAHGNKTIIKNVSTVSAPIIDNKDVFYGTVVVAGPTLRFTPDRIDDITEILRNKIGKLTIDLSYDAGAPTAEEA